MAYLRQIVSKNCSCGLVARRKIAFSLDFVVVAFAMRYCSRDEAKSMSCKSAQRH